MFFVYLRVSTEHYWLIGKFGAREGKAFQIQKALRVAVMINSRVALIAYFASHGHGCNYDSGINLLMSNGWKFKYQCHPEYLRIYTSPKTIICPRTS